MSTIKANKRIKAITLVILFAIVILGSAVHIIKSSRAKHSNKNGPLNNLQGKPVTVGSKYEMASKAHFSNSKHHQIGFDKFGISEELIEWNSNGIYKDSVYKDYHIEGYVSQLSDYAQKDVLQLTSKDAEKIKNWYASCDNYKIGADLKYWETDLHEDYGGTNELLDGRKVIMDKYPQFYPFATSNDEKDDQSELETVQKRWFQFGPSGVWLEDIQRFLVLTRYMYAPNGSLKFVRCSFGKMDLYDKDWNLVKGERLMYKDNSDLPNGFENYLKQAQHQQELKERYDPHEKSNSKSDVELLEDYVVASLQNELNYNQNCNLFSSENDKKTCQTKNEKVMKVVQARKEHILDKYSIQFPNFINVAMDVDEGTWLAGVEDPRVTVKKYPVEEPLVLFNMITKDGNRYMHAYYPLRSKNRQIKFTIKDKNPEYMEKNWTPFFLEEDEHFANNVNSLNRGYVRFIYKYNPLKILKCSLNDGRCDIVFDNYKMLYELSNVYANADSDAFNNLKAVRGASQLVPLPSVVPQVEGVNLWVTFAKTHLDNCGCGERFYRPLLIVFSESQGIYTQELLVPVIDFDLDVLGWNRKDNTCTGYNVFNPNSISSWDVVEQDSKTGKFNDYMTILTSEADYRSRRIVIRGLLDFILSAYKSKKVDENNLKTRNPQLSKKMFGSVIQCMSDEIEQRCADYGKLHPEDKS